MTGTRKAVRALASLLMAASILQLPGCAANEVRPSGIAEANRRGDDRYPVIRATTGSDVELVLRDGTVLRGRFRGVERMSEGEYLAHWEEVRGRAPGAADSLPFPGEIVTIRAHGRPARATRFEGFGSHSLGVRDTTGARETVSWIELTEMRAEDGRSWTGGMFTDLAASGRLPLMLRVRLAVGDGSVVVPADQIAEVNDRTRHPLATGVLLGFLSVTILGLAALSQAHTR